MNRLFYQHLGPKLFANHFKSLGPILSKSWSNEIHEVEFSRRIVDNYLDTRAQPSEMTGKC